MYNKEKKKKKTEKELQHFQELQISDENYKMCYSSLERLEDGKISSYSSELKQAHSKYLLHV